jgi:hypothetical protein
LNEKGEHCFGSKLRFLEDTRILKRAQYHCNLEKGKKEIEGKRKIEMKKENKRYVCAYYDRSYH